MSEGKQVPYVTKLSLFITIQLVTKCAFTDFNGINFVDYNLIQILVCMIRLWLVIIKTRNGRDLILCLVQVRLGTEVLRAPSLTRPGFELMTSRS